MRSAVDSLGRAGVWARGFSGANDLGGAGARSRGFSGAERQGFILLWWTVISEDPPSFCSL